MHKRKNILIVALILVSIGLFYYGYDLKIESKKNIALCLRHKIQLDSAIQQAETQEKIALMAAEMARVAQKEAEFHHQRVEELLMKMKK